MACGSHGWLPAYIRSWFEVRNVRAEGVRRTVRNGSVQVEDLVQHADLRVPGFAQRGPGGAGVAGGSVRVREGAIQIEGRHAELSRPARPVGRAAGDVGAA